MAMAVHFNAEEETQLVRQKSGGSGSSGSHIRRGLGDSAICRNLSVPQISETYSKPMANLRVEEDVSHKGMDFALSTDALQQRMQEIVDDELALERTRQIEDLSAKVVALEKDRQKAKDDLLTTERQYQSLVNEAREQLAQVQADQETTQKDTNLLKQQVQERRQQRSSDHSRHERCVAEDAARAEAEVNRLSELRGNHEHQMETLRVEVMDLRGQLDGLYAERSRAHEESLNVTHATRTLRDSLQDAKRKLEESEKRRAVLRETYINVGQQFEETVDKSEKENQAVFSELEADVRHGKRKYDKYKQRFDKAEAEIQSAEATIRVHQSTIEDKTCDITRLHHALDAERDMCSRQELRYLSCLRQKGHDDDHQERIAVSMHQRLLEEQARHFRERMHDMDRKLKLEIEAAAVPNAPSMPSTPNRRLDIRSLPSSTLSVVGHASPARRAFAGAGRQETMRRAEIRADVLHVELREKKDKIARSEGFYQKAEEQRQTFANSLHEANLHLARLQRIVENERWAETSARAELGEVREHINVAQTSITSQNVRLRKLKAEKIESDRLCSVVDENRQSVAVLEENRERLRHECHLNHLEMSTLAGECQSYASQMESAEGHLERFEEQRVRDQSKDQRLREAVGRMQQLIKMHVKEARSRVDQLRLDSTSETRTFYDRCQEYSKQFNLVVQGRQQRGLSEQCLQEGVAEDARRRARYLEQQVEMAANEIQDHEVDLERTRSAESRQEAVQETLLDSFGTQKRNIERVLHVLSTATSCSKIFDEAKARIFNVDGLEVASLPEFLSVAREGLEAAHERARASAKALERDNVETHLEADARRAMAVSSSRQTALSVELTSAESRRDLLASEARRQRAGLLARAESCTERSVELKGEAEDRESKLEAVYVQLQAENEEVELITRQMQSLQIETSLSVELSRTDAAEPLKLRLYDLLSEVDELQQSFQQEFQEIEKRWTSKCTRNVEMYDEETDKLRWNFNKEAELLRREIGAERTGENGTFNVIDSQENEMNEQLTQRRHHLDEKRTAVRQLEGECEHASHEEMRNMRLWQEAESKLSERQQARLREQESFAECRAETLRRQERELNDIRRAKDTEVSALRARLQHSLSGLSAVGLDAEDTNAMSNLSANGFQTGGGFNGNAKSRSPGAAAAERLAARARHHLGFPFTSPGEI